MRGERSTGAPTKGGEKANKRKIKIKGVKKNNTARKKGKEATREQSVDKNGKNKELKANEASILE